MIYFYYFIHTPANRMSTGFCCWPFCRNSRFFNCFCVLLFVLCLQIPGHRPFFYLLIFWPLLTESGLGRKGVLGKTPWVVFLKCPALKIWNNKFIHSFVKVQKTLSRSLTTWILCRYFIYVLLFSNKAFFNKP